MKISLNWLKKFIEINETPEDLESILTEVGLEVDEVFSIAPDKKLLRSLVVGEILSIEKHPHADRLSLTSVDIGDKTSRIICGARNTSVGQKVVIAKPGTKIKNTNQKTLEIKKTKIRGIESDGMICAEDEIGIGNAHDGIIILPKNSVTGKSAIDYLNIISDTVYDISLTPNRADATSHLGVARDIKAVFNREIDIPEIKSFSNKETKNIDIEIKEKTACPRYAGCIIDNVDVGESSNEIKNLLTSIGINPINNVVDITNYILHSLGQPLHAFDLDKISKNKIVVKYAKENEKFLSLDDIERKLKSDDLVICDGDEKPMCIAGVFGGKTSGVSSKTKSIFLESAYFNPSDVRKSSQNHMLKTDASYRFERGIDPNITVYALKLACVLIKKYCKGKVVSLVYDIYPKKIENNKIEICYDRINKLIGQKIGEVEINNILKKLDINVSSNNKITIADVPPYRVDVLREADIVEEILRIYGYNNIKLSSKNGSDYLSEERSGSHENIILSRVMDLLVSSGLYEITTNSLTSLKYSTSKEWDRSGTIEMVNKLSDEHAVLKQDLLYTGLECIKHNLNRKQNNLKFFEFDKVYNKKNKSHTETKKIGIYLTGLLKEEHFNSSPNKIKFFDLLNLVNKLLVIADIKNYSIEESKSKTLSKCFEIKHNKKSICKIGNVNKNISSNYDIDQEVYFCEIEWKNYIKSFNHEFSFSSISKFPEVKRDLSLVLSKDKKFSEISHIIDKNRRNIIKNYSLYDIYEGENLGDKKIAYALRFVLQDVNKTLEEKTINSTMENLMVNFEKILGAEIRK
ncbi:MAG: phenylalanine--tRNA ligase subunit beta [Cytophagales bacterium]